MKPEQYDVMFRVAAGLLNEKTAGRGMVPPAVLSFLEDAAAKLKGQTSRVPALANQAADAVSGVADGVGARAGNLLAQGSDAAAAARELGAGAVDGIGARAGDALASLKGHATDAVNAVKTQGGSAFDAAKGFGSQAVDAAKDFGAGVRDRAVPLWDAAKEQAAAVPAAARSLGARAADLSPAEIALLSAGGVGTLGAGAGLGFGLGRIGHGKEKKDKKKKPSGSSEKRSSAVPPTFRTPILPAIEHLGNTAQGLGSHLGSLSPDELAMLGTGGILAAGGAMGVGAAARGSGDEREELHRKLSALIPSSVVAAVQTHGLHKVAAQLLNLPEVTDTTAAMYIGRKMASRLAERRTINTGLAALEQLSK